MVSNIVELNFVLIVIVVKNLFFENKDKESIFIIGNIVIDVLLIIV